METPEPSHGSGWLHESIVDELIDSETSYKNFGKEDALSAHLYQELIDGEARDGDAAGIMVDLINACELHVDKSDPHDELNHLRLRRLIALVRDMPTSVSDKERLKVWHHLLVSDWVHMYDDISDLRRAIERVAGEQPHFALTLDAEIESVRLEKIESFRRSAGWIERSPVTTMLNFDFKEAMAEFLEVCSQHPEAALLYNSQLDLSIISGRKKSEI